MTITLVNNTGHNNGYVEFMQSEKESKIPVIQL